MGSQKMCRGSIKIRSCSESYSISSYEFERICRDCWFVFFTTFTISLYLFLHFLVPSGFLTIKEQRDMMLMIGGQKPDGPTICKKNWPRGSTISFILIQ